MTRIALKILFGNPGKYLSMVLGEAKAKVDETRTEIERRTIRAQVAGEVLQINLRPGEFVGTPPTDTLILLGSTQKLHLRVDIDEHDIPRVEPGSEAVAMLKGYPERKYPLQFVRVEPYVVPKRSLTGRNTERIDTRVLQVVYALPSDVTNLYVGQQMDVFIKTDGRIEDRSSAKGR